MKYILILVLLFISGLSVGTAVNMYKYGHGVNDAFWRMALDIDEVTIWAKDFSEEKFSFIRHGMTY